MLRYCYNRPGAYFLGSCLVLGFDLDCNVATLPVVGDADWDGDVSSFLMRSIKPDGTATTFAMPSAYGPRTPLLRAIELSHSTLIKMLLEKGAAPLSRTSEPPFAVIMIPRIERSMRLAQDYSAG